MGEITKQSGIKNWQIILICMLTSFLFMMICSNNSFLYSFNDHQDINWYVTMGNGLLNGKLPYRDLYEQKGPIIYFLFAIFCMFENPYRMVFVCEVILFALFLYISYKIMVKVSDRKNSLLSVVPVTFIILTSSYFVVGGTTVEEFCLPIFSYMLLCFVEFVKDNKAFSPLRTFAWGIFIALLLFIKFTLLFFPGFILLYIVAMYMKEKKYKEILKEILIILLGIVAVTLPVCYFFLTKNGLVDFLEVYFYDNIFKYKKDFKIFINILNICIVPFVPFSFMILGVILLYKKNDMIKKEYTILFLLSVVFLAISGNFAYYFLPLVVFSPIGVVLSIEYLLCKYPKMNKGKIFATLSAILLLMSIITGNATIELNDKKDDYVHFEIAEDIRKINNDNPTLFCYKMLDYGFYNVLGVVPNVKYFANNVFKEEHFPLMYNEFRNYIASKETEFLLMEEHTYENEKDFISNTYQYYKKYSYRHHKDNYRSFDMNVILLIRK